MSIEVTFANIVSSLALLISAGSFYVTWMNRKDAAKQNEPRLWLTMERFEGDYANWRWVYVNVDNRSKNWVRLLSVRPIGGTRLHPYDGPLIGGELWQFPDKVTASGFTESLDLAPQEAAAAPGDDTVAQFLVQFEGNRIRVDVTMKIAAERHWTKRVRLEANT